MAPSVQILQGLSVPPTTLPVSGPRVTSKNLVSHRTAEVSHSLGGDLHARSSEDLVRQIQQTVVDQNDCLTTDCVVVIQLAHFL